MNIKMGNGSSILMSDKGDSVKSIFQDDKDIIAKQAEQIKMLRSTLIDTLTVVQGGLSSTIANGVKALEETKEHA